MTTERVNQLAEELIQECLTILNKTKGKDYGEGEDQLANFKDIAKDSGLEPLQVWMVLTGKHVDAIRRAVKANPTAPTKQGEPLRENFKDLVLYGLLGYALLEEAHELAKK